MAKPGLLFRLPPTRGMYHECFTRETANLEYLSCGEYEIPPGGRSAVTSYPEEEALLFMWRGNANANLRSRAFPMAAYDVLYVPKGESYSISNSGSEGARLFVTRAPAENVHPVFHSKFADFSKDESRIRHLMGKDVLLMFDVSEKADKLVAGYTFFKPFTRSWPPHNHTDQEEVYIFIRGHGSMEVYESPEILTFVREVGEGDAVTIPFLNYHPVFSQESPLEFILCIAGFPGKIATVSRKMAPHRVAVLAAPNQCLSWPDPEAPPTQG